MCSVSAVNYPDAQLLRACEDEKRGDKNVYDFSPQWSKGDIIVMEKFCVLNFVKGLKYTLAENYIPQFPDGELVLSQDYRHEDKPRYFWITCEEDGKFWITPIHKGPKISVDRKRLTGSRPLDFGNWIGVDFDEEGFLVYIFVRRFDFNPSGRDLGIWGDADNVTESSVFVVDLGKGPSNTLHQLVCDIEASQFLKDTLKNMKLIVPPLDDEEKIFKEGQLLTVNIRKFLDSPIVMKNLELVFLSEKLCFNEHLIATLTVERYGSNVQIKYGEGVDYL